MILAIFCDLLRTSAAEVRNHKSFLQKAVIRKVRSLRSFFSVLMYVRAHTRPYRKYGLQEVRKVREVRSNSWMSSPRLHRNDTCCLFFPTH